MPGKVTVNVELADGTIVQYEKKWSGGNPAFEGAEAERAAQRVAADIRTSIEATHGTLPKKAVF